MGLVVFFLAGVLVCAIAVRYIVRRYEMPWREALQYFGLAPYPGEEPLTRRLRR